MPIVFCALLSRATHTGDASSIDSFPGSARTATIAWCHHHGVPRTSTLQLPGTRADARGTAFRIVTGGCGTTGHDLTYAAGDFVRFGGVDDRVHAQLGGRPIRRPHGAGGEARAPPGMHTAADAPDRIGRIAFPFPAHDDSATDRFVATKGRGLRSFIASRPIRLRKHPGVRHDRPPPRTRWHFCQFFDVAAETRRRQWGRT